MIPSEIDIPVSFCDVSPFSILPFSTDASCIELSLILNNGGSLPLPIVRPNGSRFEVIQGWDLVHEIKHRGIDRVKVKYGDYSDAQVIEFGIIKQAEILGLHWVHVARALYKAKNMLKWNDTKIAESTGKLALPGSPSSRIDRTKVARMIKIAKKLSPKLMLMAETNRLTFSACRRLVTLPVSLQEEIAKNAIEKSWNETNLLERAFPKSRVMTSSDNRTHHSTETSKSTDIKRLEIDLSEIIGYPVDIKNGTSHGGGELAFQFFSREDLIAIISKLVKGFRAGAKPKGKLVFTFDDLDQFDEYTGNFFSDIVE